MWKWLLLILVAIVFPPALLVIIPMLIFGWTLEQSLRWVANGMRLMGRWISKNGTDAAHGDRGAQLRLGVLVVGIILIWLMAR